MNVILISDEPFPLASEFESLGGTFERRPETSVPSDVSSLKRKRIGGKEGLSYI